MRKELSGRALPCQGKDQEFNPLLPLSTFPICHRPDFVHRVQSTEIQGSYQGGECGPQPALPGLD